MDEDARVSGRRSCERPGVCFGCTRNPDAAIADLLRPARTIAVLGLSDDPERPSYRVARAMQRYGYRIMPVNPMLRILGGHRAPPTHSTRPYRRWHPASASTSSTCSAGLSTSPAIVDDCIRVAGAGAVAAARRRRRARAARARAGGRHRPWSWTAASTSSARRSSRARRRTAVMVRAVNRTGHGARRARAGGARRLAAAAPRAVPTRHPPRAAARSGLDERPANPIVSRPT